MDAAVPATTKVKYTRVRNIDTDRLQRRQRYLRRTMPSWARKADGRADLRQRAREMLACQAELRARGVDILP